MSEEGAAVLRVLNDPELPAKRTAAWAVGLALDVKAILTATCIFD